VTGFAELTKIALDFLPPPGYVERSRDAVWMIPMFDAALFLIIGALLSLIARWVRLSWHLAAGILVALGTLLPLLLIQWLHPLAAVVVATGVGVQVGRWLSTRVPAARRLVSRSLPWLAGAVGVLALLTVDARERNRIDWSLQSIASSVPWKKSPVSGAAPDADGQTSAPCTSSGALPTSSARWTSSGDSPMSIGRL